MTSRVFVIADLHFGHKKAAEARGFSSVDAHDAALDKAWRDVVTKRDVVYVLGDVFDESFVMTLPGIKKLAMGNHDKAKMARYLSLFSQVRAYYEFDGCLLSHIPVHPGQFGRYEMNVHGHTHARSIMDDERYVPTSVEVCPNFAPMLLRELIEERRRLIKNGGA